MADADLQLRVEGSSNLPEVLEKDERAIQAARRAREKAERDLAKLIEKGDPLKALERRQARELAKVQELHDRQLLSAQKLEEARLKIAERHARERLQLEERTAAAAIRVQEQAVAKQTAELGKMKTRITDVRSAVGALSGATSGMFGQWSAGAASIVGAFATGGAVSLAIAGVAAGVAALTSRIREQREEVKRLEEEARAAALEAEKALEDRIQRAEQEARRRQDAALGRDRELVGAQQTLADLSASLAAKEADLTAARNRLMEEGTKLAAAREASQGIETETTRALERSLGAAQEEVSRLGAEYLKLENQLKRTAGAVETMGQAARSGGAAGATAPGGSTVREGARFGADLMELQKESDEIEALMEDGLRRSRDTIHRYAADAQKDLADYLRQSDPFAALDAELGAQVSIIEGRIRELQAIARDPELRAEALRAVEDLQEQMTIVQKRYLDRRDQLEIAAIEAQAKASRERAKDAVPDMDPAAAKRWEAMGWSAGASVVGGMASYLKSNDPLDLLRTVLSIGGGIANILLPGSGGIVAALGGFFQRGGSPYAFHMPQGRQGLALGPGPSNDAKPAWLHPREVVLPADVVERDFGGLPEAMAVAAGRGLPARGAATIVERVEVRAFDSQDALRGLRTSLAPAQVERRSARQGALEAASMGSWGLQPRTA